MIHINLKHKDPKTIQKAADFFANKLKATLKGRVKGPAIPGIPRLRSFYQMEILIKIEKNAKTIQYAKQLIQQTKVELKQQKGFSSVRVNIDVDPQ